mgnify:CR=1 FL=1
MPNKSKKKETEEKEKNKDTWKKLIERKMLSLVLKDK